MYTLYQVVLCIMAIVQLVASVQFEFDRGMEQNADQTDNTRTPLLQVANMTVSTIRRCLDQTNTAECMRQKLLKALDLAIQDNGTWPMNEFVTFERNPEFVESRMDGDVLDLGRSDNTVTGKLNKLLRSRRVQFHTNLVPSKASEGRKKKNKQGGGMMFGGLAMAAVYAQLVLGKITMLAAAAFVLAKIALVVATTASLKKHVPTSSSSTEHIVYATDHSSGHDGYRRNTFRSMGAEYATAPPPYAFETSDELKDRDIRLARAL